MSYRHFSASFFTYFKLEKGEPFIKLHVKCQISNVFVWKMVLKNPSYKILSKTFHRSIGCFKSSISACHAHIDEKPVGHQLFLLNDRNFQQLTQKAASFVCVECRISFEVYKEQLRQF